MVKTTLSKRRATPDIAKSALQKGYRRGDADLLRKAFDYMWNENPEWVLLRTMVFASEDSWKSALELGRAVHTARDAMRDKYQDEARSILLEALLNESQTKKNMDGNGMLCVAYRYVELLQGPTGKAKELEKAIISEMSDADMKSFYKLCRYINEITLKGKAPKWVWSEIWETVDSYENELSSEEYLGLRDAIGGLYFRDLRASNPLYHHLFLSACLLILQAVGEGESFDSEPSENVLNTDTFDQEYNPASCPWYVMDMHTGVGRRALGYQHKIMRNRFGYTKDFISDLWFLCETAQVNETDPTSKWWGFYGKMFLIDNGVDPKDQQEIWEKVGRPIRKQVKVFSHD